MLRWLSFLVLFLVFGAPAAAKDCVILLHGLARTELSMKLIEEVLERQGFAVVNQGYPSTKEAIVPLAMTALTEARGKCAGLNDDTPAVITHSMGAILLRSYADLNPELAWGRVVMMGPPNQGSEVIDAFARYRFFEALNGPAALELGTDGAPTRLPAVPFTTGVIAGTQSINPILSQVIEGTDDGKVSVDRTKVAGMCGHIVLPVTHTFMLQHPEVIAQAIHFLETGSFESGLTYSAAVKRLALTE